MKLTQQRERNWQNFEKIVVGILLVLIVLSALYRYLKTGDLHPGIIELVLIMVSSFIVRKGLSYFRPAHYNPTPSEVTNKLP